MRSVDIFNDLSELQGDRIAQHCRNLTHVRTHFVWINCAPALFGILCANPYIEHLDLHFIADVTARFTTPTTHGIVLRDLKSLALAGAGFGHEQIVDTLKFGKYAV